LIHWEEKVDDDQLCRIYIKALSKSDSRHVTSLPRQFSVQRACSAADAPGAAPGNDKQQLEIVRPCTSHYIRFILFCTHASSRLLVKLSLSTHCLPAALAQLLLRSTVEAAIHASHVTVLLGVS
jgi:hypothetical protein